MGTLEEVLRGIFVFFFLLRRINKNVDISASMSYGNSVSVAKRPFFLITNSSIWYSTQTFGDIEHIYFILNASICYFNHKHEHNVFWLQVRDNPFGYECVCMCWPELCCHQIIWTSSTMVIRGYVISAFCFDHFFSRSGCFYSFLPLHTNTTGCSTREFNTWTSTVCCKNFFFPHSHHYMRNIYII